MNLGEITDTIRLISGKGSVNDLDAMIVMDVNRAYRKLCRARTFGSLVVRNEQFTTVSGTLSYVLPYPLDRIINDSLRYDLTSQQPGSIITLRESGGTDRTMSSSLYPNGTCPVMASIGSGIYIEPVTVGSTVSISAPGDTVTVTSGNVFDVTMVGKYIRFGNDKNGRNGGDYGYLISEFDSSSDMFILGKTYRGPNLTGATYQIPPQNSKWLTFDPTFTDSAKVVQYDWYSKPQRLYSPDDVPEVEELSDAIVYQVLAENPMYHRPDSYDRLNYVAIARDHLVAACKTALQ